MTLDSEGNVYITRKGVTDFDKTGKAIKHIDIKKDWMSNVTFGGKDQKAIY